MNLDSRTRQVSRGRNRRERSTELRANLSKYLRLASRGTRIVVKDRDEPIAEIGPPASAADSWRDRLVKAGRLRAGTQDWGNLRLTRIDARVGIQASLRAVRERNP